MHRSDNRNLLTSLAHALRTLITAKRTRLLNELRVTNLYDYHLAIYVQAIDRIVFPVHCLCKCATIMVAKNF